MASWIIREALPDRQTARKGAGRKSAKGRSAVDDWRARRIVKGLRLFCRSGNVDREGLDSWWTTLRQNRPSGRVARWKARRTEKSPLIAGVTKDLTAKVLLQLAALAKKVRMFGGLET